MKKVKQPDIARRRKETREAATALREDLIHLRSLLATLDPKQADLRRSSAILRRLLVDRDLAEIAAPRIGKFVLQAPDNKPIYTSARKLAIPFFVSGGAKIFGIWMRCLMVERAGRARQLPHDFDVDRLIDLPIDSFCKQPVLCFEDTWISRAEIIKYVANVGSGVHSDKPKSNIDRIIRRVRQAAKISVTGEAVRLQFNTDAFHKIEMPIQYDPAAADPVLIELLVTAHLLANSPDILRLEAEIDKELA